MSKNNGNGKPSPNGGNGGRDERGRFASGNPGGPGNPHARQVNKLRTAMLNSVTEDDLKKVVKKLVNLAIDGNVPAAKEVLDRCLGKPVEADLIERLDQLEGIIERNAL
tara:strand:+ start:142 stop:468 length:327 start_codon:yes stop_codon:yes gene_type:complete